MTHVGGSSQLEAPPPLVTHRAQHLLQIEPSWKSSSPTSGVDHDEFWWDWVTEKEAAEPWEPGMDSTWVGLVGGGGSVPLPNTVTPS